MLESGLLLAHFPLLYKGADEVQLMIAVLSCEDFYCTFETCRFMSS